MKLKKDVKNNFSSNDVKRLSAFLCLFLFSLIAYSQTPQGFNYQSVVRNAAGEVLSSTNVGVQFKLHEATTDGTVVYTETHTATTNAYGVFNLIVGQGTTADAFLTIDWSSNNHFLEVSIDTAGGTTYVSMGTTQLLSVPYALQAKYVENGDDLGNHTLTENLKIGGNWISNDGDDEGLLIGDAGRVTTSNKLFLGSNINLDAHWINGDGTDNKGIQFDTNGNTNLGGNLKLSDNWISNDGDDEGIKILDNGTIELTGNIKLGDNWLNNDGGSEGLQFDTDGNVTSSGKVTLGGNLQTNSNWISNDGDNEGIAILANGNVGIGESNPQTSLDVADTAVIGNIAVGTQSSDQSASNQKDQGFTTTNWLYTSTIESVGERDNSSTLITVGAGSTFGKNDEIHFVTNGKDQVNIKDGLLNVSGDVKTTGNFEFDGVLTTTSTENQIFGSYDDTSNLSNLSNRNVIIGHQAAEGAQSGRSNVVIGYFAGYNLQGDSNVLIGTAAGAAGGGFSNQLHIRDLVYGEFDNDLLQVKGELKVDENIATDGNVIIDEDGDDLRAAGAANNVEMISLIISADGSINSNVTGSSGITTSLSDETYTINYNNHFSDIPAVTITCLSTTARTRIGQIITLGQGKVTYKVKSENNNSETDAMTIVNIVGKR
ncbi:hypothetical protein [Tenacibaculum sp. M341]|uniref:hypothetical protein n=1 Tax=Tenacibaculum sp. M341 TaxID=2530339 RepID=UPI00104D915A|nr:hypothetical protein [Tenacibaculum sp. M341]TCI93612.1 hypothetical protein EYW44_04160 [Tenacibaculum sp. M341]